MDELSTGTRGSPLVSALWNKVFQRRVLIPSPTMGADNPASALLIFEALIAGLGIVIAHIKKYRR